MVIVEVVDVVIEKVVDVVKVVGEMSEVVGEVAKEKVEETKEVVEEKKLGGRLFWACLDSLMGLCEWFCRPRVGMLALCCICSRLVVCWVGFWALFW